ncbi:conjugal transfer protein TraF [Vibrio fluvialis]|nr:conjugal transfer protein TraF [Vibrio fluvialis]
MKKYIIIFLCLLSFGLKANELQTLIDNRVEQQKQLSLQPKKKVMKKYGLIIFFSDECPYCQQFAPILKRFTDENNIIVRAVSFTGRGLPDFPTPIMPTEQAVQHYYGASEIRYPAVWLYDPDNPFGGKIRLTNGYVPYEELERRWITANQPQYTKVFE